LSDRETRRQEQGASLEDLSDAEIMMTAVPPRRPILGLKQPVTVVLPPEPQPKAPKEPTPKTSTQRSPTQLPRWLAAR
jgi:hypothetical protein